MKSKIRPYNNIQPFLTIFNTDFTSAGFAGMRGVGTGTINLTGVSGIVTRAFIFWHGPTNSSNPTANASVTLAGVPITGTNIGFSADNGWGFANSQAYMADVTSVITGNGNYSLGNFLKADAEINGVSLLVFFNDGNSSNNRDIVLFRGNDSNQANSFDSSGWSVTLSGINYTTGSARLQLHVSDGQGWLDDALVLNGQTLEPSGPIFQGDSTPHGTGCCGPPTASHPNGFLWDIKTYDITSFLSPGPNTITLTTGFNEDFLSLIVAAVDLPAGSAPSCNLTCPPNITKSNDRGQCGAIVNYTPPSALSCTVTCSPPPNTFFPVGTTTVTCAATPSNPPEFAPPPPSTCSFTVTILDTEAPTIACPTNVSVQCAGAPGPKYTLPSVTDNCGDGTITCVPPPDANFGLGTTVVNCEARDQAGNSSRCSFTVTVKDTTPPTITSCPTTPILIPNAGGACSVPLIDVTGNVTATDNCPGPLLKTQNPPVSTPLEAGKTHPVSVVVQDAAGNQSACTLSVTVPAGAPAMVQITPATVDLGSVKLFAATKKKKVKPSATEGMFTVENTGCSPVTITPKAITRVTDSGKMNPDDSAFFKVTLANGQPFTSATLVKGAPVQLKVTFNPSVPGLSTCGSSAPSPACLNASNVLPSSFTSMLSFNGTDKTVTFAAGANKGVKLIDKTNPSAANGLAQLCRSGDQFTVTYFVYDSDTSDVKSVKYEFLDSSGNSVKVIDNVDLVGPIGKAGLVNGMSFKVQQTFSGANDNDNVTKVRVTVTGGSSNSTAESSGSSDCGATVQSLWESEFTTVLLPARRLNAVEP